MLTNRPRLRKFVKIALIVLVLAFVIGQFVRPDFTNPEVDAAETLPASGHLPAEVDAVLQRSCNDCHTNTTNYPWYAQVSPFSWFLNNHIQDGRKELNFSKWNTYEKKRKLKKLDEVCEQVQTREMPLPSYLWIHWDARLKDGESKLLCDWAAEYRKSIELSAD